MRRDARCAAPSKPRGAQGTIGETLIVDQRRFDPRVDRITRDVVFRLALPTQLRNPARATAELTGPGPPRLGMSVASTADGLIEIRGVDPGGRAASAGLVAGDIILGINEKLLAIGTSQETFRQQLAEACAAPPPPAARPDSPTQADARHAAVILRIMRLHYLVNSDSIFDDAVFTVSVRGRAP